MTDRPKGEELLDALETGQVRVAKRLRGGRWLVNEWVKAALLDIFRTDPVVAQGEFRDKASLTLQRFDEQDEVRLVPGGSAVRRGARLEPGVVCMPPMYVNVGAFVGEGSMIDSHALIGSCAQLGARVHVSAGAQIGGVLEPVGASPVIVEDDVFIGGNCGLYEGVLIRERAVLAAGVVLTSATRIFDNVHERELENPIEIPAGAVVVPGSRPMTNIWARDRGLQLSCAIIVKYRDEKTSAATELEGALR